MNLTEPTSTNPAAKRRPLVLANWKMNGRVQSNLDLLSAVERGLGQASYAGEVDVGIAPPAIYINQAISYLGDHPIGIGAQDVSARADGAYTGELSAAMLQDIGVQFALVGHSERRQYHGESSQLVADKAKAALEHDLVPIVCVGETMAQRQAEQTHEVISQQLAPVLALGAAMVEQVVIAYEPIWAIGTGLTATPEAAQQVHALIRTLLAQLVGHKAQECRVLYGGSVKGVNAFNLFSQPDIDGGLIGGASLDANEFLAITRAAAQAVHAKYASPIQR